jgi:hypothetical protein
VRRIFGLKRYEMIEGWRKLHNEKLRNLKSSENKIRMIKSKWMRWTVHVVCMGAKRNTVKTLVGKPEEISHQNGPNASRRIILKKP